MNKEQLQAHLRHLENSHKELKSELDNYEALWATKPVPDGDLPVRMNACRSLIGSCVEKEGKAIAALMKLEDEQHS